MDIILNEKFNNCLSNILKIDITLLLEYKKENYIYKEKYKKYRYSLINNNELQRYTLEINDDLFVINNNYKNDMYEYYIINIITNNIIFRHVLKTPGSMFCEPNKKILYDKNVYITYNFKLYNINNIKLIYIPESINLIRYPIRNNNNIQVIRIVEFLDKYFINCNKSLCILKNNIIYKGYKNNILRKYVSLNNTINESLFFIIIVIKINIIIITINNYINN